MAKSKTKTKNKSTGVGVLHVTTWKGSSTVWWAQHYYARLKFDGEEDDIDYALTAKEAAKLSDDDYKFKAGDTTGRFFSEEKLRSVANEVARAKGIKWLIEGETSICDPQRILYGEDQAIVDQLNSIWDKCEANNWWEGDEPTMEALSKEWKTLAFEHGIVEKHGSPNVPWRKK